MSSRKSMKTSHIENAHDSIESLPLKAQEKNAKNPQ